MQGRVNSHLLCLTRLAEDKALKVVVQKWRSEHSDWRILANFLLSKNTSRHFKRSEQKRKITKDGLLVEKELMHKRLETQVSIDYFLIALIIDLFVGCFCCAFALYLTGLSSAMLIWASQAKCKWRVHLHNRMPW